MKMRLIVLMLGVAAARRAPRRPEHFSSQPITSAPDLRPLYLGPPRGDACSGLWPLPKESSCKRPAAGMLRLDPASFNFVGGGKEPALQRAFARYKDILFRPVRPHAQNVRAAAAVAAPNEYVAAVLKQLTVSTISPMTSPISLQTDESYELLIQLEATGYSALLTVPSFGALTRGLETFSQLTIRGAPGDSSVYINSTYVSIHDEPRFAWRGMMIDTSRHFHPTSSIRRMIDAISFNRMNVLHWHITDEQSFPLETKAFPKLVEAAYGGKDSSMRYNASEVRALVAYGLDRGVRLVPEIDSPGHSASWQIGYPQVGVPVAGWASSMVDPTKEESFALLKGLFTELSELFVDEFIHIGCDEVDFAALNETASIVAYMQKHSIPRTQRGFKHLIATYIARLTGIIRANNRTPIAWQEAMDHYGESDFMPTPPSKLLPNDLVIEQWLSPVWNWANISAITGSMYAGNASHAPWPKDKTGFRAIVTDGWYLDSAAGGDAVWQTPYAKDPLTNATCTYSTEMPLGNCTCTCPEHNFRDGKCHCFDLRHDTSGAKERVLGGEACLWGERTDAAVLPFRAWPGACAVAERLWSPMETVDVAAAKPRLERQRCRMIERGIDVSPNQPGYCKSDDDTIAPAAQQKHWHVFPFQDCSTANVEAWAQTARCPPGDVGACKNLCLETEGCGGFDTTGALKTAACGASRDVARKSDLYVLADEAAPPPRPSDARIDHVVILLMENRAADHLLGCLMGTDKGFDGIPPEGRQIPVDPRNASRGNVTVSCGTAKYICAHGGSYNLFEPKFCPTTKPAKATATCQPSVDFFKASAVIATPEANSASACCDLCGEHNGCEAYRYNGAPAAGAVSCYLLNSAANKHPAPKNVPWTSGDCSGSACTARTCSKCLGATVAEPNTSPYSKQSDDCSVGQGAKPGETVEMFSAAQLPIKSAVAEHFGVFNKLYTAVPSASTPNHLFSQSATSCGISSNIYYNHCGGKTSTFPQNTIFDSMLLANKSFAWFVNTTDPQHVNTTGQYITPILYPDIVMDGVSRHKDRFLNYDTFYKSAAAGTLPALSWVTPGAKNHDHPCSDIALGERLLKDTYEALRAGKNWERTLFAVMYDDTGGFYDHVVPPFQGVPADESPCTVDDVCDVSFDFKRLGMRSTAMLMSPWVPKGTVFQEPKGPYITSQFNLASIPATVKNIFNLSSFLTKRDAWSGSFDELLLPLAGGPRTDTPLHFPTEPPPAHERRRLMSSEQRAAEPEPMHCSRASRPGTCGRVANEPTAKQLKLLPLLAELTGADLAAAAQGLNTFDEHARWIQERYNEFMKQK